MKRTTYILIGIFFSGLFILVGTLFALAYIGERERTGLDFVGKAIEKDIASFRVVNINMQTEDKDKNIWINDKSGLVISPAMEGKSRLSFPKDLEKCLSAEVKNDTLYLIIDFSEILFPEELKDERWIMASGLNLSLTVDSVFAGLYANPNTMKISLKDIKTDSMILDAPHLEVDSCDFNILTVDRADNLELNKSKIAGLYLNLNTITRWKSSDCQIDTEYLTGDGQHYCELAKGECRQMIWSPQTENAKLQINISDKAVISLQK